MLLMICFPYVFECYESEAILNLVLGGEIFWAKVAVALNRTMAILLNICRVLKKDCVSIPSWRRTPIFFWIDGKVLLIFLLMRFYLLDSFVLFICLLWMEL